MYLKQSFSHSFVSKWSHFFQVRSTPRQVSKCTPVFKVILKQSWKEVKGQPLQDLPPGGHWSSGGNTEPRPVSLERAELGRLEDRGSERLAGLDCLEPSWQAGVSGSGQRWRKGGRSLSWTGWRRVEGAEGSRAEAEVKLPCRPAHSPSRPPRLPGASGPGDCPWMRAPWKAVVRGGDCGVRRCWRARDVASPGPLPAALLPGDESLWEVGQHVGAAATPRPPQKLGFSFGDVGAGGWFGVEWNGQPSV